MHFARIGKETPMPTEPDFSRKRRTARAVLGGVARVSLAPDAARYVHRNARRAAAWLLALATAGSVAVGRPTEAKALYSFPDFPDVCIDARPAVGVPLAALAISGSTVAMVGAAVSVHTSWGAAAVLVGMPAVVAGTIAAAAGFSPGPPCGAGPLPALGYVGVVGAVLGGASVVLGTWRLTKPDGVRLFALGVAPVPRGMVAYLSIPF
jgi:hypothetical protein